MEGSTTMNGVTLLENICAYNTPSAISIENCGEIYLRPDYRAEVLIEVKNLKNGNISYVPFLIDPSIEHTTFSARALHKTQLEEGTEVQIMNTTIKVIKGNANAMGMDFLKNAIIGYNYLSFKAGIAFIGENNTAYTIGLPLNPFKDTNPIENENNELDNIPPEVKEKFNKLDKKHEKKMKKLKKKINKINEALENLTKHLKDLEEGKNVPKIDTEITEDEDITTTETINEEEDTEE